MKVRRSSCVLACAFVAWCRVAGAQQPEPAAPAAPPPPPPTTLDPEAERRLEQRVTELVEARLLAREKKAAEEKQAAEKKAADEKKPEEPPAAEPFAFGDFTWLNGNSRQKDFPLDSKVFTGQFMTDANYTYSFTHPKDHSLVGSTTSGRTGEIQLSHIGIGGDLHWNNVRGHIYNRLWFFDDHVGLTLGGGAITNPGRYLVLVPPINGATALSGSPYFTANAGDPFMAWDSSATLDYMPNQFITGRVELVHRHANVPYFAGPNGITPDGGNQGAAGSMVPGFHPDLVRDENRIQVVMMTRL